MLWLKEANTIFSVNNCILFHHPLNNKGACFSIFFVMILRDNYLIIRCNVNKLFFIKFVHEHDTGPRKGLISYDTSLYEMKTHVRSVVFGTCFGHLYILVVTIDEVECVFLFQT